MDKINKFVPIKIKSVNEEKGLVEAVVSSESIDRYGEIIEVNAYTKRLKTFMKHPVLLSSHNYSKLTNQIGIWEKIWVEGKEVIGRAKYFINSGNPESDWGFFLAKNGVAAFSVGFLPYEWEDGNWEKDGEAIKAGKKPCRKYKDIELLEISQVLVPANSTALQKSIDNIEEDETIKEYAKEIFPYLTKYMEEGGSEIDIKEYSEEVLEIIKKEEHEKELISDSISIKSNLEEDIIIKNKKEEIEKKEEEEMKEELLKAINDLDEKLKNDLEKIFIGINELNNKLIKQNNKDNDNNNIETEIKEKKEKDFLDYAKELFETETNKLKEIFPVQS